MYSYRYFKGGLGNQLFQIAGTIGIAYDKKLSFGFPKWDFQKYFRKPLPPANDKTLNLTGYLQDYKLWQNCEHLIKEYLTPKDHIPGNYGSVFIHFRAYADENATHVLPEMTTEYYAKAMEHFPKNTKFTVFSDNIEKAKQIIDEKSNIRYLNTGNGITDFKLMAMHKGAIISNSTFAWWSAYLTGGKVVMPKKWFNGAIKFKDVDVKGLQYKDWIII